MTVYLTDVENKPLQTLICNKRNSKFHSNVPLRFKTNQKKRTVKKDC